MVTEVEKVLTSILGHVTTVQDLKSKGKLMEEHFG